MRVVLRLIELLIAALVGVVIAIVVVLFLVMPRMQWNATAHPSAAEHWVARYVLSRWVAANAGTETNPVASTAEILHDGEHEYDDHCAVCHGLDGGAENRVGGDFYPPIAHLSKGAGFLSDGQLYFFVSNGIRMTAMPGFGPRHSPDELWRIILWVRHFPHLTPNERAAIQARMKGEEGGETEH
jgi:mono/diheme cytochrome c family protein